MFKFEINTVTSSTKELKGKICGKFIKNFEILEIYTIVSKYANVTIISTRSNIN